MAFKPDIYIYIISVALIVAAASCFKEKIKLIVLLQTKIMLSLRRGAKLEPIPN